MKLFFDFLGHDGEIRRPSGQIEIGKILAADAEQFSLTRGDDSISTGKWGEDRLFVLRYGNHLHFVEKGDVVRLVTGGRTFLGPVTRTIVEPNGEIEFDSGGGALVRVVPCASWDLQFFGVELTYDAEAIQEPPPIPSWLRQLDGTEATVLPKGARDLESALTGHLKPEFGNRFGLECDEFGIFGFTTETHDVWVEPESADEIPDGEFVAVYSDFDSKLVAFGLYRTYDSQAFEYVVIVGGDDRRYPISDTTVLRRASFR